MKSNVTVDNKWQTPFSFGNNIYFYINYAQFVNGTYTFINKIYISIYNTVLNDYSEYATDNVVNDNTWHHIVWTLSYSSSKTGTWQLYIDNVLTNTFNNTVYPYNMEFNICRLGLYNSGNIYYNGFLDEFYIFDRVLTAADVSALYNV
jgi:hypothetical protein